ncbi:MAG: 16S rRNA (guanine(966)-N(2))-methyltransferase RsmD [Bacilli bacterium]
MKVISGALKGRNIVGYNIEGTRPTMDRVKESLFSMIQNYIDNAVVLDLFAGSGSLAIEAISNGASYAYLVDNNIKCIQAITKNINNFNIESKTNIIKDDYGNALNLFKNKNIKFDIIFLDPPYKNKDIPNIITYIMKNGLLSQKGIIICEISDINLIREYNELELIKNKKYADKYIIIYKNKH